MTDDNAYYENLIVEAADWIITELQAPQFENLSNILKTHKGSPGKIVGQKDLRWFYDAPFIPELITRDEFEKRKFEKIGELTVVSDEIHSQWTSLVHQCEDKFSHKTGGWSGTLAMQVQWRVLEAVKAARNE